MTETIRYLRVRCRIVRVTHDAVHINVERNNPGDLVMGYFWIPLSLIHTLDERTLTSGTVQRGDEMVLRIAAWKVRALNLPTEPTT